MYLLGKEFVMENVNWLFDDELEQYLLDYQIILQAEDDPELLANDTEFWAAFYEAMDRLGPGPSGLSGIKL